MKQKILSTAVALSFVAGAVFADTGGSEAMVNLGDLTLDQLDALTSILSGLPRQ